MVSHPWGGLRRFPQPITTVKGSLIGRLVLRGNYNFYKIGATSWTPQAGVISEGNVVALITYHILLPVLWHGG